ALRIQQAGHAVTGVDVSQESIAKAETHALPAVHGYQAAPRADVVVVMVATPGQLETLVRQVGEEARGQLWIIMSTVGPESVRTQGEALRGIGARVVDSPVTGGVARARTGSLTLFVSGEAEHVQEAESVLRAMGTPRHVGRRLGDGQAIKVVNQHLCSVHLVAAAEALNLARGLGLEPGVVLPLIEKGAAGSWMLSDRGPRMLEGNDVEVTSAITIFQKDSGLVAAAAEAAKVEVPLLDQARGRFQRAVQAGLGALDDSRVIETWR
ncbi:NAD(P)-dependent oxidoreductase, partial [Achromobacter xylosoxidans]|uniref:NAD(P)-dependent oxidoreductase n=2 Tax=Alcaligenes xylosoxydans xylosoxydans TaxID=85698 RepID=UPI000668014C